MELKLGVVSDEISRNFREAVRIGRACGLTRYEVRYLESGRVTVCDEGELREVAKIANGEGVEITAISPGLFKHAQNEKDFRREMREIFPRAVELAHRWGLSRLIIFGFQKLNADDEIGDLISSDNPPPFVVDCLREASNEAARTKMELLIESEPICWADTAQATAHLVTTVGSNSLGVNYDPSNIAWAERRDPIDEFDLLAPFISNVHIKNQKVRSRGSGKPVWTVPNKGVLKLEDHFVALQRIGYKGPISLEPHIKNITPEILLSCKIVVEEMWQQAMDQR